MIHSDTLCVNQKRYVHQSRKQMLGSEIDLLAWLETQTDTPKLYWKSRDSESEMAAIGSVLLLNEVPLFDAGNDASVRFWGGHSFFPSADPKDKSWHTFPRTAFFLPKHELIKTSEGIEVITHSINKPLTEAIEVLPTPVSPPCSLSQKGLHLPEEKHWEEMIHYSLGQILDGPLKKVVLARRSTLQSSKAIDPFSLLGNLPKSQATLFALQFDPRQTFVGATPERLYKREGATVWTEAVAGTRPRGETPETDRLLEAELRASYKEKKEFSFVKTSLEHALKPLCDIFNFGADKVLKTPNVQHLWAKAQGKLKDGVRDEELLETLHPTAAMGGHPKQEALSHLFEKEPFERGWYASPIGYIGTEGAEFVVGIRSALIEEKELHLFAGAGIITGSNPADEWKELEDKTALWRSTFQ